MLKRLIEIILILVLLVLGLRVFAKPALTLLVVKSLEQAFQATDVHIGKSRLVFMRQLTFSDIRVRKEKMPDFKIRQAIISYSLRSLLRGEVLKFRLEDLSLGQLVVDELELSDILVRLSWGKARVSGDLNIPRIKYNKAKIGPLQAKLKIDDKILSLDPFTAQIFDGKAQGAFSLNLDKKMEYQASLNLAQLDMDKFIRDFDLREKFLMTGALGGDVFLTGSGSAIQQIKGDLVTSEAGGRLTITDKRFLENLARTSQQSLGLLVESFKNYYYNIGVVKLGMEEGNLILDVRLDGEGGARNLSIVVHDVNLRRP